jgi:hypothetical protein
MRKKSVARVREKSLASISENLQGFLGKPARLLPKGREASGKSIVSFWGRVLHFSA